MKNKLLLIAALIFVLIVAGLAIFIKNQKDQIAKQVQEMKELQKQKEVEAQKQLEEQKKIEAQKKLEKQKELDAQKAQLAAEKEQAEAKKSQTIKDDIDKILVRLDKVRNEPTGYSSENNEDARKTEEERLKQLAHSVKSEIGDIDIELKSAGFTNTDSLDEKVSDFFDSYDSYILDNRISYDYIEMGLNDKSQEMQSKRNDDSKAMLEAHLAIMLLKQ